MSSFIVSKDKPLGDYVSIYLARALDENIRRRRVGSGGAVTSILVYMLENNIVDVIVVAKRKRGLEGEIVIARTKDEIIKVAGDRWNVLPFTAKLRDTLLDEEISKVAIIGLPCQAQFLKQMKLFPLLETDFSKKIHIVISLFCMGTYATEAFLSFLKMMYNLESEKILNIQLRGEYVHILTTEGDRKIPTSKILPYVQMGCLICPDYSGIFSDISAGVSETRPGYTVLISRTENADKIINDAKDKGFIELKRASLDIVEELELRANSKLMRAAKYASMLL